MAQKAGTQAGELMPQLRKRCFFNLKVCCDSFQRIVNLHTCARWGKNIVKDYSK